MIRRTRELSPHFSDVSAQVIRLSSEIYSGKITRISVRLSASAAGAWVCDTLTCFYKLFDRHNQSCLYNKHARWSSSLAEIKQPSLMRTEVHMNWYYTNAEKSSNHYLLTGNWRFNGLSMYIYIGVASVWCSRCRSRRVSSVLLVFSPAVVACCPSSGDTCTRIYFLCYVLHWLLKLDVRCSWCLYDWLIVRRLAVDA